MSPIATTANAIATSTTFIAASGRSLIERNSRGPSAKTVAPRYRSRDPAPGFRVVRRSWCLTFGCRLHRIKVPCARHAFEFVVAAILQLDARPGDEVGHRAGHQHFVRSSQRGDASADV